MVNKLVPAAAATLAVFLTQALPVAACGGLIAPNGAIRLEKATTLVAWHDGVERYLTSFSYNGEASSFGWIPRSRRKSKRAEGGRSSGSSAKRIRSPRSSTSPSPGGRCKRARPSCCNRSRCAPWISPC